MIAGKKRILSLLNIIFLDQACFTITFPLITLIFFDAQSRLFPADTSYAMRSMWYGICISLPNVLNIIFASLLSALSDEFGRKKILLIEIFRTFLLAFIVGLGIYWASLKLIFLGFVIKGAFARPNPVALAIMGDIAPKEKKILYMGYLQFAISVGAFLGPVLGGYLSNRFFFSYFNFSLPFFIAAIFAVVNVVLAFALIQETFQQRIQVPVQQFHTTIKEILTQKAVLRISLLLLLIQISWSTYYQFTPAILKTAFGFDSYQLGWFIGMIAFWLAITTGVGIKLLDAFLNLQQMLLISVYLVAVGLVITLLACAKVFPDGTLFAWLGAIPIAAGDVIAYSCLTALYSNAVAQEQQGKVMAIGFMIVALVWAMTGFLGGFCMRFSPLLPLILAPVGILVAILLIHAQFGKKLALGYT